MKQLDARLACVFSVLLACSDDDPPNTQHGDAQVAPSDASIDAARHTLLDAALTDAELRDAAPGPPDSPCVSGLDCESGRCDLTEDAGLCLPAYGQCRRENTKCFENNDCCPGTGVRIIACLGGTCSAFF